jgi:hypothetical protein
MTTGNIVTQQWFDYMKTNKVSINRIIKPKFTKGIPILNILQDAVYRTNKIVIHTYNFLKLYILYQYEKNLSIPHIDADFVKIIMKVVSLREHNAGRKPNEATMKIMTPLMKFYDEFYKITLDANDIVYDDKLGQMLTYEAHDIVKNINTNIKEHYIDHLYKFINVVFDLKDKMLDINLLKLDKDSSKTQRQVIYQEFRGIKNDILNVEDDNLTSVVAYHKLIKYYKYLIIPKKKILTIKVVFIMMFALIHRIILNRSFTLIELWKTWEVEVYIRNYLMYYRYEHELFLIM